MARERAGSAVARVARVLCSSRVGQRIPTVSELVDRTEVSRGSVQNALGHLKGAGAVGLEAHGQLGTLLTSIDYEAMAHASGVEHLVGVMPLPYTRRYEGIATGLFTQFSRSSLRTYITFLRGSEARAQSLADGFANYCVLSRLAFDDLVARGMPLEAVLDLGPGSYVSRHVIVRSPDAPAGWVGARVGFDATSPDQMLLTSRYFGSYDVRLVPVQYSNIIEMLRAGQIDAAIWNMDDAHVAEEGIVCEEIGPVAGALAERGAAGAASTPDDDTRAVVAALAGDGLTTNLLRTLVDVDELGRTQQAVMAGEMLARY